HHRRVGAGRRRTDQGTAVTLRISTLRISTLRISDCALRIPKSTIQSAIRNMSLARDALLALSTNRWLRERATKTAFVRRSVSTFMPGERLEDAMAAAQQQQVQGIGTILT